MFEPSYLTLLKTGELEDRARRLMDSLNCCRLCPRECLADRKAGAQGSCRSPYLPVVSAFTVHKGEEPVLSGSRGVGNIFFGNCNLRCLYCQNYQISQNPGTENEHQVSLEALAEIMLELQGKGVHSIGLVSPTHFAAQILGAICIAAKNGLRLPIIYNSNCYDSVQTLKLFEGVADIYLPDLKYGTDESGKKYSMVDMYFTRAKAALKEMYRQVGRKILDEDNLAKRGLIIRHLVLPGGVSETERVFEFISNELSPLVHISLMAQYFPAHRAKDIDGLNRPISRAEYESALCLLDEYGLAEGWVQELDSRDCYRPEFDESRAEPFH